MSEQIVEYKKISADISKNIIKKIEDNDLYGFKSRQKMIESLLLRFIYKKKMKRTILSEIDSILKNENISKKAKLRLKEIILASNTL